MTGASETTLNPHPAALVESLRSIGYTLDTALADIIDNSISADASNISVRFLWNSSEPWLAIADDGHGMLPEDLTCAMRFGSSSPLDKRAQSDLGRFGLGMKTASISQCRQLTVISKKDGILSACEWDLDRIAREESDQWRLVHLGELDLKNDELVMKLIRETLAHRTSGTIVLWRNLVESLRGDGSASSEARFDELLETARSHLETVFHRFIVPDPGHKATRLDFNGSELTAFNPFGPSNPARQELSYEEIPLPEGIVAVQPYVLPHRSKTSQSEYEKYAGEAGYLQNQGFYIYRERRLIVKATWFRLIKKEELNKLIRVRVDIPNSLDHRWNINVNKSQVRPPEAVRLELKKIIRKIEGRGKMVFRRRAVSLQDRGITPVWKREVRDGKIHYCINEDHPLVSGLLSTQSEEQAAQMRICLKLIGETFPADTCFADVAGDHVELGTSVEPDEIRQACEQLINALRACGFEEEQIREQALKAELPGKTPELINSILDGVATNA